MKTRIQWKLKGGEDPPVLLGDFTQWEPVAGELNDDCLNWYFDVESDARLEYCFQKEENVFLIDPENENKVHNGLGPMSELVMPDYTYNSVFTPFRTGLKSSSDTLRKMNLYSNHLGYTKDIWVLDTDPESDHKEMVIFQDGLDYIEYAHAEAIFRYLRSRNKIRPVLAVFVNPPNRHQAVSPNRTSEYGMNPSYAAFIGEELIPLFDNISSYSIVGASYGGLCAIFTACSYPDIFHTAYSQSGYVGFNGDAVFEILKRSDKRIRIIAEIGTWERSVGRNFLNPNETDFLSANRRLKLLMEDLKIPHIYNEHHEGHTWGYWRNGLLRMLPEILNEGEL